MLDPIIEEMNRRVFDWRHRTFARVDLERYAAHLRDVVQPQLDELEKLKADTSATKKKVSA